LAQQAREDVGRAASAEADDNARRSSLSRAASIGERTL
jgi:hypothetical protein